MPLPERGLLLFIRNHILCLPSQVRPLSILTVPRTNGSTVVVLSAPYEQLAAVALGARISSSGPASGPTVWLYEDLGGVPTRSTRPPHDVRPAR